MKQLLLILAIFINVQLIQAERLCFVGDMGTGTKEQYKVADAMKNAKCDAIMVTGDVVYPIGIKGINDAQFMLKFLTPYKELLRTTKFYLSLGNHDYYGDPDAWLQVGLHYPNIVFPHFWYKFDIDGYCLYSIDTNGVKFKQWKWLRKEVKKDTCRKKIVFGHHPYRSSGDHGDVNFIKKAMYRYAFIGKVNLFVAGHDHHLSDEGTKRGTRLLISGAGGKLRPLAKKPVWGVSDYGFVVVDSSNDTYTFFDADLNMLYSAGF